MMASKGMSGSIVGRCHQSAVAPSLRASRWGPASAGPLGARRAPLHCSAQLGAGESSQGSSEAHQPLVSSAQQQHQGLFGRLPPQLRFLHLGSKPLQVPPRASAGGGEPPGGGSSGGSGGGGGGGGGGDGGGEGSGGDKDEDVVLNLKEVESLAKEKGVQLPPDMLEIAGKFGLRASVLNSFFTALKAGGFAGLLVRTMPYFRDRILADNLFLFKVGAEVVIDSGCATLAEVRKRGKDFWTEFDFYLSDLVVGLVLDVTLVSLMAPAAVLGGVSKAAMATTWLSRVLATIPSAFFEASVPGVKTFGVGQRFACLLVKFLEYSLAGITCGLVGQGVCNGIMHLKRSIHGVKEDDVPVPPLFKTALVWGLFMGLSSNIRYQIVFGLERLVDLTVAKSVPSVAYGTTLAIRFVNNVIGGENFIDMARWAGVQ